MENLYMNIQLEEPTIEYVKAKEEPTNEVQTPVVEEAKEPFMEFDVPSPTIEMPKLKSTVEKDDNYDIYLNYQDYLYAKYGESWSTQLDAEEKAKFIEFYNNSHDDKIIGKTDNTNYTR